MATTSSSTPLTFLRTSATPPRSYSTRSSLSSLSSVRHSRLSSHQGRRSAAGVRRRELGPGQHAYFARALTAALSDEVVLLQRCAGAPSRRYPASSRPALSLPVRLPQVWSADAHEGCELRRPFGLPASLALPHRLASPIRHCFQSLGRHRLLGGHVLALGLVAAVLRTWSASTRPR